MTKTSKKILLVILFAVLAIFMFNAKVFAISSVEEAVAELKDKSKFPDKTVFVGQKVELYSNNSYNLLYYIRPTVTSNNTKVVDLEKDSITELIAKSEGTATITLTYDYTYYVEVNNANVDENEVVSTTTEPRTEKITQSYKITVKKPNNANLQSKTNDVVSLTNNYLDNKTKVLLANGELWNLNGNTGKLDKKETGNVKKYTYGDVYFREGKSTKWPTVYHMLKNNNKLTTKTDMGTLKASKVVDVAACGYLNSKGKFYGLVLKADKLSYKQKAKNVEALLGDYLLKKSDGLYTIGDVKIVKAKIKDAIGDPGSGIYLDSKNVLYKYTFDAKTKKYKTEKVEKNVKEILNWGVYKTKKGKIKTTYKGYTNYEYKNSYYTSAGQYLRLKYNGNLYIEDTLILKNVAEIEYSAEDFYQKYIVKKDGSIWLINIGDNSSLKQIRSGKDSAKGLSIPTKVKAKKKGSTKAKVTWKKVDGATKYTVYRATSKNGKYKQVGTAKGGSYTDKTVKKGKKYFYKVVANGSKKIFNSKKSEAAKVKM